MQTRGTLLTELTYYESSSENEVIQVSQQRPRLLFTLALPSMRPRRHPYPGDSPDQPFQFSGQFADLRPLKNEWLFQ